MTTDLFGDVSPQLEGIRTHYHEQRFWQLNSLIIQNSQATWQYLMTVNGGGAVALLAYIGAVPSIRSSAWPYVVLASFMTGLIIVGLTYAFNAHKFQNLQDGWNKDVDLYYKKQITWAKLLADDNVRTKNFSWLPWVLGWAAFLLFLFGVAYSTYKIVNLQA